MFPQYFIQNNYNNEKTKKSLAQEVRQKSDASFNLILFVTQPLGHCTICKESPYTKNEYNLFLITNEMINIFTLNHFFQKKQNFLTKLRKTIGGAFDHFLAREGEVLLQKLIQPFLITD